MATKFVVGQVVFRRHYQQKLAALEPRVVVGVGRKWVTVGASPASLRSERFDPDTMQEDGGKYPSRANYYISEQAYLDDRANDSLWLLVQLETRFARPGHLTYADLSTVLRILRGQKG